MRIGILAHGASPFRFIYARAFDRRGHEVVLSGRGSDLNTHVGSQPCLPKVGPDGVQREGQKLRRQPPDIVLK
jgi:hypothetical protein